MNSRPAADSPVFSIHLHPVPSDTLDATGLFSRRFISNIESILSNIHSKNLGLSDVLCSQSNLSDINTCYYNWYTNFSSNFPVGCNISYIYVFQVWIISKHAK